MIAQRNSTFWFKLNGLIRYILLHSGTKIFPLYVVNEYPKSGGSWIGEMLSDALGVPFPRNRLPMFRSSILHGHFTQSWNMHNVLIVWRDGRDVLISHYFHCLFVNDRGNEVLVEKCRSKLSFSDYHDVRRNLPIFMDFIQERRIHPRLAWGDFAQVWARRRDCVHVKYEDMRGRPTDTLVRVVNELCGKNVSLEVARDIVRKHSFETVSKRAPGTEDTSSFMRKGVVGDWKNYFDRDARERFDHYSGDALIDLGYEKDRSWVGQPSEIGQN